MLKLLVKKIITVIKRTLRSHKKIVRILDSLFKKDNLLWVFPQCYSERVLKENSLAVLEALIKTKANVKIVILYYGKTYKNDTQRKQYNQYSNISYINILGLKGLLALLRSKFIFVNHGKNDLFWRGVYGDKHTIVNLWHGIPLKTIRHTTLNHYGEAFLNEENRTNTLVICSSKADQKNMADSFAKANSEVPITGLPRNDFLHCKDNELPEHMLHQQESIKTLLAGRQLVLYAPTWRQTKSNEQVKENILQHLQFDYSSESLHKYLEKNNLVLGLRLHPNIKNQTFAHQNVIDLSSKYFSSTQVVLRNTEMLITDYSSIWIDYIQLKRKVIGYFPDHEYYLKNDRSLLYDLKEIFPGEIFTEFSDLVDSFASDTLLEEKQLPKNYQASLALFHEYIDTQNAQRVIDAIT